MATFTAILSTYCQRAALLIGSPFADTVSAEIPDLSRLWLP